MLVFTICCIAYSRTISRHHWFHLVLANSKLNEVSVTLFRENKKAGLPSDGLWVGKQGAEPGLPSVLVRVTNRLLHPALHIASYQHSDAKLYKVRGSFTKLLQKTKRCLNMPPCPQSIWIVSVVISWQPTDLCTNVSLLLCGMLKRTRSNYVGGRTILFVLWDAVRPCWKREHSHHSFIASKVSSKPETWKRSKSCFLAGITGQMNYWWIKN